MIAQTQPLEYALKLLSCLQVYLVKFCCCRQRNSAQISQENISRTVNTYRYVHATASMCFNVRIVFILFKYL